MVMLPLDIEMTVHEVRLRTVSEVVHQRGYESEDLFLGTGVRGRGIHGGVEAQLLDQVTGSLIPFEKCVDCLPVGTLHIRIPDQLGNPVQDLLLVVVEGGPAREARLFDLHDHSLSKWKGMPQSGPSFQSRSMAWALMRIWAAGWPSFPR